MAGSMAVESLPASGVEEDVGAAGRAGAGGSSGAAARVADTSASESFAASVP